MTGEALDAFRFELDFYWHRESAQHIAMPPPSRTLRADPDDVPAPCRCDVCWGTW